MYSIGCHGNSVPLLLLFLPVWKHSSPQKDCATFHFVNKRILRMILFALLFQVLINLPLFSPPIVIFKHCSSENCIRLEIILIHDIIFIFTDSETTDDEGDQFETKEDGGNVVDQAVHKGIQRVSCMQLLPQTIMDFLLHVFY